MILLDEPLSNLDAKLREEARAWLRELIVTLGLSALFVTHDQVEAMAMSDRILLLNGGVIEQQGTPTAMYGEPATLFTADFMGSNNRLEGKLVDNSNGRATIEMFGERSTGMSRTKAAAGRKATGIIRIERVRSASRSRPQPAQNGAQGADVSRRTLGAGVRARESHGPRLCVGAASIRANTMSNSHPMRCGCFRFSA